jgi:hypothetical protein
MIGLGRKLRDKDSEKRGGFDLRTDIKCWSEYQYFEAAAYWRQLDDLNDLLF